MSTERTKWAKLVRKTVKKYLGKRGNTIPVFTDARKYGYRIKFCWVGNHTPTHIIEEQLIKDTGFKYIKVYAYEPDPTKFTKYDNALIVEVPFYSEDGSAEEEWRRSHGR